MTARLLEQLWALIEALPEAPDDSTDSDDGWSAEGAADTGDPLD